MATPTGAQIEVSVLESAADARGASYVLAGEQLATLDGVADVHVASILPGHVRGNHFHAERAELIVVIHEDAFSLHFDAGAGTPVASRTFQGAGAVAIAVPVGVAHALRNDGARTLWLVAASDGPYDPAAPDAHPREVIPWPASAQPR